MQFRQRQNSRNERSHHIIPQEVLEQLRAHLDSFPAHIQRMVIILVESGMSVNEVCSLSFDCLLQDEAGNWFLRSPQLKTRQVHIIPLSYGAASAIHEQQQAVGDEQGATTRLLFPNPKGSPFSRRTLMNVLNRIARDRSIRDASGTVWRFHSHQFRYTVIARLINNGVPLPIIQYYLNVQSLDEVVGVYKHLFIHSWRGESFPLPTQIACGKEKWGERRVHFDSVEVPWISQMIIQGIYLLSSAPHGLQ